MIRTMLADRPTRVFLFLTAFFVANALIAECIGTKLFSLEATLGLPPSSFTLFGQEGLSYVLTCGVILWPLEFVLTDVVNEYFGPRAVRRISLIAICLIAYAFVMFYLAIEVPADEGYWVRSGASKGIPDMQIAFEGIFGQGMMIIIGSIVAFGVSQILDAYIFQAIKKRTGDKKVWLRATGSTLVSQLVDSYIVLMIAFGKDWGWQRVLAIGAINYSYKAVMALLLTPAIYGIEALINKYLGKDKAAAMRADAAGIPLEKAPA